MFNNYRNALFAARENGNKNNRFFLITQMPLKITIEFSF